LLQQFCRLLRFSGFAKIEFGFGFEATNFSFPTASSFSQDESEFQNNKFVRVFGALKKEKLFYRTNIKSNTK